VIIDVMRTSDSRPDLLALSTESIVNKMKFSGTMNWFLHEDFLNRELSKQCVKWANESGLFKTVIADDPPVTQGNSLDKLFKLCKTDYILNWEDDWELIADLDLNEVVGVMDENPDVNQVCFNKRPIMREKPGFIKKEVVRSGKKLTTNPHWAFLPALWRRSFISKHWFAFDHSNIWDLINRMRPWPTNGDYIEKHIGTYYWGGIETGHYIKHIGHLRSVRVGEEQTKWAKS